MEIEIRADGLHIIGYVNVTGKMSRPVLTPSRQRVIEVIEERSFQRALEKATNVQMTLDHDGSKVLAETSNNSLQLKEDAIGLRAEAVITNLEAINGAKDGKLKGWSFGMKKVVDSIEERTDGLPIRHVKDFELDHITLVMNKTPCYAATSIELRADDEIEELETRSTEVTINVTDLLKNEKEKINYSKFENRIHEIKANL